MRYLLIIITVLTPFISNAQLSPKEKLEAYRADVNEEFGNPETSILDSVDVIEFHGLDFFEFSPECIIEAKFKRIKKGEVIGFATSTSRIAKYREYGKLIFKHNGKKCQLIVYEPAVYDPLYPDHLFLPFKDFTNGDTSYGGGRYLDLSKKEISKKMTLDFNYCYNPYCAYSDNYSCPVPPDSNHLKVEIRAGVKGFDRAH